MKRVLLLTLYLNTWLRGLFWLGVLGLVLLAATVVTALLFDRHTAFGLSLYAYGALLGLPYFAVWYPFRQLIASRRLSLLPYFHVHAGLALLLLTVLVSIYLPLSAALLWREAVPWHNAIYLFFIASLYVWLLQWLCTSTLFLPVMSFGPFVFILLTQRFDALQLLPRHPVFGGTLLLLTLAGWLWALRVLATTRVHAPPLKALASNGDLFGGYTNWYLPFSKPDQASSSPSHSLLLGYPDCWFNRAQYHFNMLIAWPLLLTSLMALIGELSTFDRYAFTLILVALVCSFLATAASGELAARARLIWLRHDGDRYRLWTIIERLLLGNIAWQTLFLGLLSLATWNVPLPPQLQPFNLLVTAIPIWLLGTYCTFAARAGHWPGLAMMLLICVLGPGVALAYNQSMVPLPLVGLLALLLSLAFRALARVYFLRIDWRLVPLMQQNAAAWRTRTG